MTMECTEHMERWLIYHYNAVILDRKGEMSVPGYCFAQSPCGQKGHSRKFQIANTVENPHICNLNLNNK